MLTYYDTGVLVPLYVEEVFSDRIATHVERRNEVILFNLFHQLELENALRLKVFRGEINDGDCRTVLNKVRTNLDDGKLALRPVDWLRVMEEARRLGARVTERWGCRTLDLMHVAVAVQWQCAVFVTADDRRLKAAGVVGLETVDVRMLGRRDRTGGANPGASVSKVRERRVRYGSGGKKVSGGASCRVGQVAGGPD